MFFAKVFLHQVLFVVSCTYLYFYSDLNSIAKISISLHSYVASYFASLWIIKFLYSHKKVDVGNKCVLITGCDSGFGHQSALLLNKLGFKVFATCLEPHGVGAKELIDKAEYPKRMIIIQLDVTKDKDIESAYGTVKSSMSSAEQFFGLVNNAGIAVTTELEYGPDLTDCKKLIDVNVMGMIKITRQFLPLIRQSKGRIINIESMAALLPIPHAIFYGVAKTGAAGFSDNLRIGMYRFGVSVVSINPWLYKTALTNTNIIVNQYEKAFKNSSEEIRQAYGKLYLHKVMNGLTSTSLATESNDVPNVIASALTVYEPDARYIIAPFIYQLLLRAMMWMPKETLEVFYQITTWFVGTHKVYPDD